MPSAKSHVRLSVREKPAKDIDPEADINAYDDDASDSHASDDENLADTEHYTPVGRSKLRQKQSLSLGPAYRGTRVSRAQLDQSSGDEGEEGSEEEEDTQDGDNDDDSDDFDDPDKVDLSKAGDIENDGEIYSDDAFGTSDKDLVKRFTFRGSSKPQETNAFDGSERDESENDSEHDESENESGSDDEDDLDDDDGTGEQAAKAAAIHKAYSEGQRQTLASISQSAKADADKGFAIRRQRRTFDALLNLRIRMQKALTVSNSLHAVTQKEGGTLSNSTIENAASSVVELLDSIQNIRQTLCVTSNATPENHKRKRGDEASNRTELQCQDIFNELSKTEETAVAKRRKVLNQWAVHIHPPTSAFAGIGRRSQAQAMSQALTEVLDEQLMSADRFIHRTRVPRSCAPIQATKRIPEDPEIYDDADFYQLLLKELVDQRTADSSAPGNDLSTVRWAATAAKEAKTRKVVDRQASKGRKMRFTVNEKMQNVMPPEDEHDWEPEEIDRFFSNLLGPRMGLHEYGSGDDDGNENANDPDDGVGLEEENLHFFYD